MIEVKNIVKSYGSGESRFRVLQGISLEIQDGDFVVILGASGSGKFTLLNVISGLERPDSGQVFFAYRLFLSKDFFRGFCCLPCSCNCLSLFRTLPLLGGLGGLLLLSPLDLLSLQ